MSTGSDAAGVLGYATSVAQPLALAGLSCAVLFLVVRQALTLPIFASIGGRGTLKLLRLIVDRLFVLALVVSILALLAWYLRPGKVQATPVPSQRKQAEQILDSFYAGDTKRLWGMMSDQQKQRWPYDVTRKVSQAMSRQFAVPPMARTFLSEETNGGTLTVLFEAQFDEVSLFREGVQFAVKDGEAVFYGIDVWPAGWPPRAAMNPLQTPPMTLAALLAKGQLEAAAVKDQWIVGDGLPAEVVSVGEKRAEQSCDLEALERQSGLSVHLNAVLGACSRKPGEVLAFAGRVVGVQGGQLVVAEVRFKDSTPSAS